jgi:hypothetical protein
MHHQQSIWGVRTRSCELVSCAAHTLVQHMRQYPVSQHLGPLLVAKHHLCQLHIQASLNSRCTRHATTLR